MSNTDSLPVSILYPVRVGRGSPPASPVSGEYRFNLLAEGDSWFTLGGTPSSNILNELRLTHWTQVFTLAYPGETLRHMGELGSNPDFKKYLTQPGFNYPFDGLLLSGGGNDLIDAAAQLIKPNLQPGVAVKQAVNAAPLADLLDGIVSSVKALHALWNSAASLSQGKPIFLHTYDYVTPRNAPATLFGGAKLAGPWIYPVFHGTALPIDEQQRITDYLFDQLAETLLSLDSESGSAPLSGVYVVDTRNTLVRANPTETDTSNDWLNEIHPTGAGYRKIAARLCQVMNRVL